MFIAIAHLQTLRRSAAHPWDRSSFPKPGIFSNRDITSCDILGFQFSKHVTAFIEQGVAMLSTVLWSKHRPIASIRDLRIECRLGILQL